MPTLSGRVLLALVPLIAVPLTALPAAAEGRTAPPPTTTVAPAPAEGGTTLVGLVREYAGVSTVGADLHHFTLHTSVGAFDLVAPGVELPVTGTRVAATGTLTDDTLTASSVRVLEAPAARSRAVTRARTSGTTKSLVLRVYWKGGAPAKPTTAVTKEAFLTDSDRWFTEVSGGEYGVKGKVTPWLKLKRKPSCASPDNTAMREALAKAKKKGFSPKKFGRYVLYLPCSSGFVSGYASLPGKNVWMFGNTDRSVIMHEQGHNLGLDHANHRFCKQSGVVTSFSGNCSTFEYGDPFDTMGNRSAGHFSSANKKKLGWAKTTTLTGSGTVALAPYVGGGGVKGLRVKVSASLSYWLEYRTKAGVDSGFASPDGYGVQIRRVSGRSIEIIDARPESGDDFVGDTYVEEIDASALGVGTSVTTPEGIRLQTVSRSAGAATVKVTFKAGAAKAPAAPTVTAVPAESGASVSWTKPDDRGAVITRYLVSAPGVPEKTVRSPGGDVRSTTLSGLTPNASTTVSVRAVNEAGAGSAGTDTVVPFTLRPTVSLTSPTGGTVKGMVDVTGTATANPTTGAAITEVTLLVDGFEYDSDTTAPYSIPWQSWEPGSYQLALRATDAQGRSATSAPVTVTAVEPTFAITSPATNSTLTGQHTVTYSLSDLPGWDLEDVSASINGDTVGYDPVADGSITVDVRQTSSSNGPQVLELQAYDPVRGYAYARRTFTLSVPARTAAITSPAAGAPAVNRSVTVAYSFSPGDWPWDSAYLEVDGEQVTFGEPVDGSIAVHTGQLADGARSFRVVLVDDFFNETRSPARTVTVDNPALSAALTSPVSGSTISGSPTIGYSLTPTPGSGGTQWPWSYLVLYDLTNDVEVAFAVAGDPLVWFTEDGGNGTRSVQIRAYDEFSNQIASSNRSYTVANP